MTPEDFIEKYDLPPTRQEREAILLEARDRAEPKDGIWRHTATYNDGEHLWRFRYQRSEGMEVIFDPHRKPTQAEIDGNVEGGRVVMDHGQMVQDALNQLYRDEHFDPPLSNDGVG